MGIGEDLMISTNLLNFLETVEGFMPYPYKDAVGYWTIGVGHLITNNDLALKRIAGTNDIDQLKKSPLSTTQVRDLLRSDMDNFRNGVLNKLNKINLPENKLDAILSLVFNIGIGAFKSSTLAKILLAHGTDTEVIEQFMRWNKASGRTLKGLTKRRIVEIHIYLGFKQLSDLHVDGMTDKDKTDMLNWLNSYWG